MSGDTMIIGAGWIGRHLATSLGVTAIPQREAIEVVPPSGGSLIIAGGRSSVAVGDNLSAIVEEECSALSAILDRAHQEGCRVVVLGSSDVCGSAEVITGSTPVDPLTPYARLKAARELVVVDAIEGGLNAVVARVAPVHGPGKAQTARLVRLARRRVIAVPGGVGHSVGFITLADLTSAVIALASSNQRGVVSIGAGVTPIGDLLRALGWAQGITPRLISVPVPFAERLAASRSGGVAWLGRFALPRRVEMEVALEPMSVESAAEYLTSA
jgi:nucleoside-diphosphate-sugar epimerase